MAVQHDNTMDTARSGIRFFRNITRVLFILLLLPWFPVAVWALVIISDGPATPMAVHLVALATLVYPLLVALSIFLTRNSRLQQLSELKIAFLSLIPLLSPWPYMLVVMLIFGEWRPAEASEETHAFETHDIALGATGASLSDKPRAAPAISAPRAFHSHRVDH